MYMQYDNLTQAMIDQQYEQAVSQMWEFLSISFENLQKFEKNNPDKKDLIEKRRNDLRFIDKCFKIYMHKAKSMEQDARYWQDAWKRKDAEVNIRRVRPEGIHPVEKAAIIKMLESDEVKSSRLYDPGYVQMIKRILTEEGMPMRQTHKSVSILMLTERLREGKRMSF